MSDESFPLIVVADDSPHVLRLVRVILEAEGYRVLALDDSIGALKTIHETQPSLVIADLNMPNFDGEALYSAALRRGYQGAFLLLSADPGAGLAASRMGVRLLRKPFDPSRLLEITQELLAVRQVEAVRRG